MRCLVDTNILVSAALFPRGLCAAAYIRAVKPPFSPLVCAQVLEELRRVFYAKFPQHTEAYARFARALVRCVEVVPTPPEALPEENLLEDAADRPILRAALSAGAVFLLTGDKGFKGARLKRLRVLSAKEFLALRF